MTRYSRKMRRGAALPPGKRQRTARSQRSCTITDTPPPGTFASPLTGTDFEKEGQRRYAVAACFYLAFLDLYPKLPEALRAAEKLTLPPWGMLTGVRPDKPITRALMEGKTPEEAKRELKARYLRP